jgi:hypothetical protein
MAGGRLTWTWTETMNGARMAQAVRTWQETAVEAVVWERAGGHRTHGVRDVGLLLIEQPAGSPDLNPAEHIFEELRRAIEGQRYATIEEKVAAVAHELVALAADPARVQSLAGWSWIAQACQSLPANTASP